MIVFVTGQATLHWGRLEFGNIGNYYVAEPFFRKIRDFFRDAEIITTLQFSDSFLGRYNIQTVPKELYYDFDSEDNLSVARSELENAEAIAKGKAYDYYTDYVQIVHKSDLFIDLSGDIWGDNANFLGKDRFEVGLIKDKIAQVLNKKNYMLAGSPGPFNNQELLGIAKDVYSGFDIVTNRESISTEILKGLGFDCTNTVSLACPSWLAQNAPDEQGVEVLAEAGLLKDSRPIVGLILCGWDFREGPFDKWPRRDDEYDLFVETIRQFVDRYNVKICLMSHSNGFKNPPTSPLEMIHGRDYPIIKQLESLCIKEGIEVYTLNGIYSPELTRSIIKNFSMLVSGRLHGAVAGLSQYVPTVIVDYGHEPKAHKLRGFAREVNQEKYVADPASLDSLTSSIFDCWENRSIISNQLKEVLPEVEAKAIKSFELVKDNCKL